VPEDHSGKWVINEEEAALVRRIFAMYLDGLDLVQIARQLTLEKIPSKADRLARRNKEKQGVGVWHNGVIRRIIHYVPYATGVAYNNVRRHTPTDPARQKPRWRAGKGARTTPQVIRQRLALEHAHDAQLERAIAFAAQFQRAPSDDVPLADRR